MAGYARAERLRINTVAPPAAEGEKILPREGPSFPSRYAVNCFCRMARACCRRLRTLVRAEVELYCDVTGGHAVEEIQPRNRT
jgi:hypothetical protein